MVSHVARVNSARSTLDTGLKKKKGKLGFILIRIISDMILDLLWSIITEKIKRPLHCEVFPSLLFRLCLFPKGVILCFV